MNNKKIKKKDKNATFTKIFMTLLQQILSSRLLQAVIDDKKIIIVIFLNRKQKQLKI